MSTVFATEDVDITLENLLSLALGNPEIGAVNFNFLHEVITEILKHLGISNKLARITQEIDYRLIESAHNENKRVPSVIDNKRNVSVDSIMEVTEETVITAPAKDAVELESPEDNSPVTDKPMKVESKVNEASEIDHAKNEEEKDVIMEPVKGKLSSTANAPPHVTSAANHVTSSHASSVHQVPAPPNHRKSSHIHPKRSSYITQRLSIKPNDSHHQDVALLSRSIDRRESKTPASDMWHVLNINRRVEAAEAAIQGMTNLIDTINSDLEDLKTVPSDSSSNSPVPDTQAATNNTNVSISKQEQEVVKKMAAKLKSYDGKFTDMEKKLTEVTADVPKQKEIQALVQNFCTVDVVKNMIEDSLDGFQPEIEIASQPAVETKISENKITEKKSSEKKITDTTETPQAVSLQQAVLKTREPRDSRTRLAYQEISNKMVFFEQEINTAKEKMKQLEEEIIKKIELKDVGEKADKQEVQVSLSKFQEEIAAVTAKVKTLECSYEDLLAEVQCLTSKNDAFEEQQKKLAKSMRKLEQNLEDVTDNFHRTQSTAMKSHQSLAAVENASITKIRGTLYDFQEIHSKMQNDIDSLIQEKKNKDKSIDEISGKISELQDVKVDKNFVEKAMESKADRHAVDNKVNREQLDVYIGEIDRSIQDVMQKIEGTEASSLQNLRNIQQCLDGKLDSDEVNKMRSYIDTRFKNYKPKIQQLQQTEENAAASRKKLIPNCNCISCDRPIDLPITHPGASLPYYQSLPGGKALRPVTTFDLQTIRQHMQQTWLQTGKEKPEILQEREKLQRELLKLCGVRDLEELVTQTNRACGGGHTLIEQHQRNPGKPPMFNREEQHTPFHQPGERQLFETDVLGRDGHIYKGRMQTGILPSIPRKQMGKEVTCDDLMRPPRIRSPIMPRPSVQTSGTLAHGQTVSAINPHVAVNVPKFQAVE